MKFLLALMLISTVHAAEEIHPKFIDGTSPEVGEAHLLAYAHPPNGWILRSDNEVTYTSHIPNYEYGYDCETHFCRKTDSHSLTTPWTKDRVTTYKFTLIINKYNQHRGPDWIILLQDWMLIDATDTNGNHPITTIKLRRAGNGRIELGHFGNPWQFNYSTTNPIDPSDPYDYAHAHAPNVNYGSIFLDDDDIHEQFRLELTIRDGATLEGGSVTFKVNNRIVSDVSYRTKNDANRHHVAIGMYWSKWYNTEYNFCAIWYPDELKCKSTSITIKDLRIYQQS